LRGSIITKTTKGEQIMANFQAVCTLCGKRQNGSVSDTSPTGAAKVSKPPESYIVTGQCPKSPNGKHVLVWQKYI
jgi:hypothetical protein